MFAQVATLVIRVALDPHQLSAISREFVHVFLSQIFQMTLQAKSSKKVFAQNYLAFRLRMQKL
jgi:hypothetical protein